MAKKPIYEDTRFTKITVIVAVGDNVTDSAALLNVKDALKDLIEEELGDKVRVLMSTASQEEYKKANKE